MPTFLGAHVVPPEYRDAPRGLLSPAGGRRSFRRSAASGLARCCDVFVEDSAFTRGRGAPHPPGRAGGGALAPSSTPTSSPRAAGPSSPAEVGALSADHLECASAAGIAAMAEAGVVAVSLPLATLYLRPARRCRRGGSSTPGVAVAVATDFNPGSAPSCHLPLALTLACTLAAHDAGRGAQGGHHVRGTRGWGCERRPARSRPGSPPTSRSSTRPTSITGSTTSGPTPALRRSPEA